MTDDFDDSQDREIVPRYWQSIAFRNSLLGGCRETPYISRIVLLSQPPVVQRLPRSLTYLGFYVTDDCEVSRNWRIVPQYWQSIAFRNSLLG